MIGSSRGDDPILRTHEHKLRRSRRDVPTLAKACHVRAHEEPALCRKEGASVLTATGALGDGVRRRPSRRASAISKAGGFGRDRRSEPSWRWMAMYASAIGVHHDERR